MTQVHWHLLLNHFPIIGTLFGVLILLSGLLFKQKSLTVASYVIFILMALVSIPVLETGEGAEETVENLKGVSEQMMEEHEEMAETAFWIMIATGVISLIGLYLEATKNKVRKATSVIILLSGAITFGVMAYTGNLGGKIRHSEIREGSTQNLQSSDEHHEESEEDD